MKKTETTQSVRYYAISLLRVLLLIFIVTVVLNLSVSIADAEETTRIRQTAKLFSSDGAARHFFARQVAISGDTSIVGALADNAQGGTSGSAYIFRRNADGTNAWGQVTKLLATDGEVGDAFGHSVAISNGTAVITAPLDDDQGTDSGFAYIFRRGAGSTDIWEQVVKLNANNSDADDQFGWSAAISGDTIIVGARLANAQGLESGSAYIFRRNPSDADIWEQVAQLRASNAAASGQFGFSVALSDDVAIVGAPVEDAETVNY